MKIKRKTYSLYFKDDEMISLFYRDFEIIEEKIRVGKTQC